MPSPCRAYCAPANLVCGLMLGHSGFHWAAAGRRRYRFAEPYMGEWWRAPAEWGYPR